MSDALIFVLGSAFATMVPLLLAALGELVAEKAGVMNLSIEGMMAVGAVSGFIVVFNTGSLWFGMLVGIIAGTLLSAIFAILILVCLANQVVSGLAVGLLGLGVSALIGHSYEGKSEDGISHIHIPLLMKIPFVGPVLFDHDPVVYCALFVTVLIRYFLYHTKAGLSLRAVGENPSAAHALGLHPIAFRSYAILFGGGMAGLAGAYASTCLTPLWSEGMIGGRGWIAIALVVFGSWRPARVAVGAYFFGCVTLLDFAVQALGFTIPSQLMSCVPYASTIVILALVSRDVVRTRLNAPVSLGDTYQPRV